MASTSFNIEEKLDQMKACIHCGMCLPACPTYLVSGNEGHSPRGRLYLIKDLLENPELNLSNKAVDYIDNCLFCRACETACPSGVEYGSILDFARTEKKQNQYNLGFMAKIRNFAFKELLPSRNRLRAIRSLIQFLPKLNKLQPKFEKAYKKIQSNHTYRSSIDLPGLDEKERTISMPLGCVMDTVYNHVHWDTIKVLNSYGYHIYIPETNCCGALAHHSGEAEIGHQQLEESHAIYQKDNLALVMNSSGCGAFLKDHCEDLKVFDLIEAINKAPIKAKYKSTEMIATYHPACHLNHAQGIKQEYIDILESIQGLKLMPLYEADVCCGSAGFYNLIKTKMAEAIGERKAQFIKDTGAKVVLTANPGCMSQIQAHLDSSYQILHPVSVLAACLV